MTRAVSMNPEAWGSSVLLSGLHNLRSDPTYDIILNDWIMITILNVPLHIRHK